MAEDGSEPAPHRARRTVARDDSAQIDLPSLALALEAGLGRALVSVIASTDVGTLASWASGAVQPAAVQERTLRDVYRVFRIVSGADSPEVARAWFMGMNPNLDDRSPAEAIAEGDA